jgi:hypothetical protein
MIGVFCDYILYPSLNIVFCVGNYPDIDTAAKAIATINNISHTQVKYDLLDKESYQLSPCTPGDYKEMSSILADQ